MESASIDIGTNTVRLLVSFVDVDKGKISPLVLKRVVTRLGGSYNEEVGIDKDSAERTFEVLEMFAQIISDYGVEDVFATATSVVRKAKNSKWFIDEAYKRTGIEIEVIDGEVEAELSMQGVNSVLDCDGMPSPFIFDIGGGSTEFIITELLEDGKTVIKGRWSLDLGVVYLTEMFLKGDKDGKPTSLEMSEMTAEIEKILNSLKEAMAADGINVEDYSGDSKATLVGTAGTVTTLAAIDQEMEIYNADKINNYELRKTNVVDILEYLISLTLKEREAVLSIEKGREDLIIAGAVIINSIMDMFKFDTLRVSDAGLLEGILVDRVAKAKKQIKEKNKKKLK